MTDLLLFLFFPVLSWHKVAEQSINISDPHSFGADPDFGSVYELLYGNQKEVILQILIFKL
jgi:hypothetical protein